MKKFIRIFIGVFLGSLMFMIIIIAIGVMTGLPVDTDETKTIMTEQQRNKNIEAQFSPWDGSHKNLTQIIKDAMNDPGSYEHIETGYWDQKTHLVILTKYRGKNAFGGVVPAWVKAKVDIDGNVTEIIETS